MFQTMFIDEKIRNSHCHIAVTKDKANRLVSQFSESDWQGEKLSATVGADKIYGIQQSIKPNRVKEITLNEFHIFKCLTDQQRPAPELPVWSYTGRCIPHPTYRK